MGWTDGQPISLVVLKQRVGTHNVDRMETSFTYDAEVRVPL